MAITYAVENIMTRDLVTVNAETGLSDAVRLMVDKGIGSVLVEKGGKLVGILTERDVLRRFCRDPGCSSDKVEEVMSSPLVTIDGRASIGQAADMMAEKKIRRLLVDLDGGIAGIVTERDVMRSTLYVFKTLSDAAI